MREKEIEEYLRKRVKGHGGIALKWYSTSTTGLPDRLVLLPGGKIVFVELKAPGKKPTRRQRYVHDRLRALGCHVEVIDGKEQVDELVDGMLINALIPEIEDQLYPGDDDSDRY